MSLLQTVNGVDYPDDVKAFFIDPRAALIRYWLDESWEFDYAAFAGFFENPEPWFETHKASLAELVTPQVWSYLEAKNECSFISRAEVIWRFYDQRVGLSQLKEKRDLVLIPRFMFAVAEAADCWRDGHPLKDQMVEIANREQAELAGELFERVDASSVNFTTAQGGN